MELRVFVVAIIAIIAAALVAFAVFQSAYIHSSQSGGIGPQFNGTNTTTIPNICPPSDCYTVSPGERISNFLMEGTGTNGTNYVVYGLSYMEYPLATIKGTPVTLSIGDYIGYACDNSEFQLIAINANGTAVFAHINTPHVGGCPVCLSGNTTISTPGGPVNVKDIKAGMQVWSADSSGNRIAATVLETSQAAVPKTHMMVHITLADSRQLFASQGHPTADGRVMANVTVGSTLDGSEVTGAQLVQYNENYTYDILPSGPTGFYWADGILIGSTLKNESN
jgi:hypothetical protein